MSYESGRGEREERGGSSGNRPRRTPRLATPLAVVSFFVALAALVLGLSLRSCASPVTTAACSGSVVTTVTVAPEVVATGAVGPSGLSAYELWLTVGNEGTLQEFLDSLVGTPQSVTNIFIGSNGVTGPSGLEGMSAYQLWLDAGNAGSSTDFLNSLKGQGGANGAAGLSAYQLWRLEGNNGSVDDFFDALTGLTGAKGETGTTGDTGATGATGMSAYDIWAQNGGTGGVAAFLESLKGATGDTGPQGQCTVGEAGSPGAPGATGAPGAAGLSAYEIWKQNGHNGSEALFLLSLIGPSGSPGPQGSIGPQGAQGVQGSQGVQGVPGALTGFGDSGVFWDLTTQGASGAVSTGTNTAYPMYFGSTDPASNQGVSVTSGAGDAVGRASYITFTHPGVYNIAFSAQLLRTQGGSADTVSIWLRKNGVNEPNTNTDVTLIANGQKQVAAWNFFVPVQCNPTCDSWQLMWSADGAYTNIWYQAPQSNPDRPGIPSIILTVNQVK